MKNRHEQNQSFLTGDLFCIGMSLWKQAVIKPFFRSANCRLRFVSSLKKWQKILENQPLEQPKLLVWGYGQADVLVFAQQKNIPVLRMEDGFIRSVGLGSNLVAPLSLVVDDLGIYFNAQTPSRLEYILQNQSFDEETLARAERLKQTLIQQHIGKYNVGASNFQIDSHGKKAILVVGQVEDDASIRLGSPDIYQNLALLKKVRKQNPDAYIVYKPHPDVVSGNRVGHIPSEQAVKFADQIATTANVLDCINQVDEVHTMTSLAGFEALLRGKIVHCYGLPFYSNWGLTMDHLALPRRTKRITLNELIAGTLIAYPFYLDINQKQLINVEQAINLLHRQKQQQRDEGIQKIWLTKQWGKLMHLIRTLV